MKVPLAYALILTVLLILFATPALDAKEWGVQKPHLHSLTSYYIVLHCLLLQPAFTHCTILGWRLSEAKSEVAHLRLGALDLWCRIKCLCTHLTLVKAPRQRAFRIAVQHALLLRCRVGGFKFSKLCHQVDVLMVCCVSLSLVKSVCAKHHLFSSSGGSCLMLQVSCMLFRLVRKHSARSLDPTTGEQPEHCSCMTSRGGTPSTT